MVEPDVIQYYRDLEASERERRYFYGTSPEDDRELWLFEVVEDRGELVVIRQLTIEANGTRHRYSADHMEDDWGFLTDQPIDYADELSTCTADDFERAWRGDDIQLP